MVGGGRVVSGVVSSEDGLWEDVCTLELFRRGAARDPPGLH